MSPYFIPEIVERSTVNSVILYTMDPVFHLPAFNKYTVVDKDVVHYTVVPRIE